MIDFVKQYFLLIVFGLIFAYVLASLAIRYIRDNFGKIIECNVEILDKHHNSYEENYGLFRNRRTKTNYVVVFYSQSALAKISFDVTPQFYSDVLVGEMGILRYRYTKMVSFESDK